METTSRSVMGLMAQEKWLRGLARVLTRDPDAADDLVQETWIAALFHPAHGAGRSWLATVVRNLARMRARADARRAAREEVVVREDDRVPPTPEELVMQAGCLRLLGEAVEALREPYLTTVLRHYRDRMTPSEIAGADGVPSSTIRRRLSVALAELRQRLGAEPGSEGRAWALVLGPAAGALPGRPATASPAHALRWSPGLTAITAAALMMGPRTSDAGPPAAAGGAPVVAQASRAAGNATAVPRVQAPSTSPATEVAPGATATPGAVAVQVPALVGVVVTAGGQPLAAYELQVAVPFDASPGEDALRGRLDRWRKALDPVPAKVSAFLADDFHTWLASTAIARWIHGGPDGPLVARWRIANADGKFRIVGLEPGTYDVTVKIAEGTVAERRIQIGPSGATLRLTAGAP